MSYTDFLERKTQLGMNEGFKPLWLPDYLFDFQADLTAWSIEICDRGLQLNPGCGIVPLMITKREHEVTTTHHPNQFPIRAGAPTGLDRPGRPSLSGRGTFSLGSDCERQGAVAGGEPPRLNGRGGIFTTEHPLTNRERLAAWRWRQRLKPARSAKRPDRLSGWEIFGDLVAVLAFLLVLAIGLAAMWALQSVSDANASEERCFQSALSEHNYCRSQTDWGDR